MLEINHLSFSYANRGILEDLSLSFSPGKFYGIIGPNGCGKTTLIRLLCGLLSPLEGTVALDGRKYSDFSRKEWAQNISLLPQSRTLPAVSGEELVLRGRYPYWGAFCRKTEEDDRAVEQALAFADAQSLAHRTVTELSGGERQKLCLALLLAQDTPYVLLDEPTVFLDISHRFALMEQLQTLRNGGKCVIAVLHDLSLALRYCDELLVLKDGSVQAFDTLDRILSSDVLEDVFDLRCRSVLVDGRPEYLFLPK